MKRMLLLSSFLIVSCAANPDAYDQAAATRCVAAQFDKEPATLEMCQRDCASGVARACTTLGAMNHRGYIADTSHENAVAFADKGCSMDDLIGCYYAGLWRGEADDQKVRVDSFERACEEGYNVAQRDRGFACWEAAKAHVNGTGIPASRDHGLALADKGCMLGNEDACNGNYDTPAVYDRDQEKKREPLKDMRAEWFNEEVNSNGIKFKNVTCKFKDTKVTVPITMLETLGQHRARFDACGATKPIQLGWSVQLGAMPVVDAASQELPAAECVKRVLSSINGLPHGSCLAEFPPVAEQPILPKVEPKPEPDPNPNK